MENTKLLTEAQIKAIEDLADAIRTIIDKIVEFVKCAYPIIRQVCNKLLDMYHNKRVIYLATKHGNPRVRKKNINRIAKWVRRLDRCKE